jgi:ABC-type uncharacterized transport system ATPase component
MAEFKIDQIKQLLKSAEGLYHQLILVIGENGSGKTSALSKIAKELGIRVISINLELSYRLLELTTKQRVIKLPEVLDDITNTGSPIVVFDNLEILFDKELKQNPLRLLQGISRNRLVLASWNGRIEEGRLIYAEPDHPEYQNYELKDILIVRMDDLSR